MPPHHQPPRRTWGYFSHCHWQHRWKQHLPPLPLPPALPPPLLPPLPLPLPQLTLLALLLLLRRWLHRQLMLSAWKRSPACAAQAQLRSWHAMTPTTNGREGEAMLGLMMVTDTLPTKAVTRASSRRKQLIKKSGSVQASPAACLAGSGPPAGLPARPVHSAPSLYCCQPCRP